LLSLATARGLGARPYAGNNAAYALAGLDAANGLGKERGDRDDLDLLREGHGLGCDGVRSEQGGLGVEAIHGDAEEALDLGRVQVAGEHLVAAGGLDTGSGDAGLVLPGVPGGAAGGDDRGDPGGAGTAEGIDPEEQAMKLSLEGKTVLWTKVLPSEQVSTSPRAGAIPRWSQVRAVSFALRLPAKMRVLSRLMASVLL
jgi:hypothetical protein